jgi:AraC family transcriptional regulator
MTFAQDHLAAGVDVPTVRKTAATRPGEQRATPDEWAKQLSAPPDLSSDGQLWTGALIRHWTGTSPDMDQPPLDHHYIVQHMGGTKRVDRRHDGPPISTIVHSGALTVVPAGMQFTWRTRGPIEFAHLYISPAYLQRRALRYDWQSRWALIDRVSIEDPLLQAMYTTMLREVRKPRPGHALYLDCLLDAFVMQLLREHSSTRPRSDRPGERLTSFRVGRVIEFVNALIDPDIHLSDLAHVAGGSVYHFCRAFKNTVGEAPYQFVLRLRIERAHSLLLSTTLSLTEVASSCGFRSPQQLSRAFRRMMGVAPAHLRRDL